MNNELKQDEKKTGDIMSETASVSSENECENIGNQWTRICPRCKTVIQYTKRKSKYRADRINGMCRRCAVSKTGLSNIGKYVSIKTRRRMSLAQCRSTNINPFKGKHHTDETKRKMRIMACNRVLQYQRNNNGRINNVGKQEGKYFDKLEKRFGWDGIYYKKSNKQFLISNLGYFVDYYEPHLNIVVEYDEPSHYRKGLLLQKDIKRMEEIKSNMKCQFWRYNELQNKLEMR